MWKKTTGWLFEVQKRNGILEEKDRRLYEYAYGVLLGRVAIYLIAKVIKSHFYDVLFVYTI